MRSNSGKPLGIYVHIPFCKSKCEYCDFYSLGGSRDRRTTDQYLQALADHIRETGRLAPDYTVDTVYFGGGTPSFFGAENLEKILDELQKRFHFGADPEITLEANPDSVTPQGLKRLVRAGFNRISIGVQSDQDDMLKRLGRPHTYEQARMAVVRAREAGFANLSLDLMFGLPNQTLTGWRDTLENVLRLKPEHMSCYALKVEPNTPLWEYRDCANLPNDDVQADMYLAASEILQDHGYEHYEISNFAKPGFRSRSTGRAASTSASAPAPPRTSRASASPSSRTCAPMSRASPTTAPSSRSARPSPRASAPGNTSCSARASSPGWTRRSTSAAICCPSRRCSSCSSALPGTASPRRAAPAGT